MSDEVYQKRRFAHERDYDLPSDYKGDWETDEEKRLWDLSLTPEQRLERLEEMIEFSRACEDARALR